MDDEEDGSNIDSAVAAAMTSASSAVSRLSYKMTQLSATQNQIVTKERLRKDVVEVDVLDYCKKMGGDGKQFVVYTVQVIATAGIQWLLEKRYHEFRSLRDEINMVRPDLRKLPFPSKMWVFSTADVVLRRRQESLKEFLLGLFDATPRPMELDIFLQVANNTTLRSGGSLEQLSGHSAAHDINISSSHPQSYFSSPIFKTNFLRKTTSYCSLSASMSGEDFDVLKVLGKGSFGKVYLVRPKGAPHNEVYAMKVLKKLDVVRRNQVHHTKAERQIMVEISHPYVLCLRYAFQTPTKLYMITDYCPGGELFFHLKKLQRFTERMMRFYTAQVALALYHIHSKGIVYRDLKPENILIDKDGNCKITDFGLAKLNHKNNDSSSTFCGTPEYLAPEMIIHRDRGSGYGYEVDWWAVGVVAFELTAGWPPFFDRDFSRMCEKVLTRSVVFPSKHNITVEAKSMIKAFLQKDPSMRLACGRKGFSAFKSHPFYSSIDWHLMENARVVSPFVPNVGREVDDTCNFDAEFTKLAVDENSPAIESSLAVPIEQRVDGVDDFKGFSYIDTAYALPGDEAFQDTFEDQSSLYNTGF